MRIKRPASALFLVTAGSFAAALIVAGGLALRSSAAAPTTVGIDFNTADNTATSVGAITTCLEVASGGSYTLDVYVQNVPGDTDPTTPDGMVAGQYTLNSIFGNKDTARTATGGFIDLGAGIGSPGTAAVDNTASTPVNNSTGADTIVASNDPAIGVSGAEGDGFFVRMTYTAPLVGAATIVPLTLTAVTLVDASANEIPVGVINNATLIVAPDGTTNCATLPTPTPPGQTPTPTPTRSPTPTATPPGQTPTPTPTPSATPTATQPGQTPAPLTVVNNNDNGAGSLRQAIADAAPGDTIDFNAGLSGQTITLTSGELLISKDLTIGGPAGGITVSGNNVSRVFEISSGNVSMSDLTVTGGKSVSQGFQGWGGGILNNDRLALTNSTVSGNRADFGGGIFIGGSLTLTNSRVSSNNTDNSGGGIYLYYGEMTVTNSTIDGNTGAGGGGILSRGATTLTDSTVSRNTGEQGGGGIVNDNSGGGGTLTITNSTVSDNRAQGSDGGGISNYGVGGLTLKDSTVSGNLAANYGGGIFSESSYMTTITNSTIDSNSAGASGGGIANETAMTLTNSTVSGNTSRLRDGGGIYTHNAYQGSPNLALINSTVSDNSAPHGSGSGINNDDGTLILTNSIVANVAPGGDCVTAFGGTTISHGYNLDGDGTCNLTATGDLPGTNPMLDPLALNPPGTTETQALRPGSPAIDHIPPGVNGCGTTVSTDQRGVSRPQGSGCDIGAYELLNTATFSVTKVYTDGNTSAFVTIHLACTSGMITDNDQGVTGGGTLIFHVSGDAPPDGCTATETSVPVGYTSDSPCSGTITGAPTGSGSCTMTNTLNTATFTVTKVFSDGNTITTVSVSLTCANGTVTDSPQSVTGSGSVTFHIKGDTPPDSCTAAETVPTGYTGSGSPAGTCSSTITGAPSGSGFCTITNTPMGRHEVGVAGQGLGFNAPNTVKAGHSTAIHIRVENFGSVTETQIGYRVVATCSATCAGTVTLSAACTGTVGPVAPGVTFVVEASCTATATTAGDVWVLTLMVIHCGADGVFAGAPCTANDGAIDVNNSNNVAVTKITVT